MYLAHYTKRFIPEFDAECRLNRKIYRTFLSSTLKTLVVSAWCTSVVLANEGTKKAIDISAGSLESALKSASFTFGHQIVFFTKTVEGFNTTAITGSFSQNEILDLLLKDTGLTYKVLDDSTISVYKKNSTAPLPNKNQQLDQDPVPKSQIENNTNLNNAIQNSLETITVTAQRRVQNLQEVPLAITTFSGELIERQGISEFMEIAQQTPGFTGSSFSAAEPIFAIRGATNTFSQAGTSKPVGVFLDDVYISRNTASAFQLYDLEQVSVLRGPQGTLFGRNVTGGALVVNTKRPSLDESLSKVESTLGNFSRFGLRALTSQPLNEQIALKLSGSIIQQDGYGQDRLSNTEQNDIDSINLRAQLLYQPSSQFSALFTVDVSDEENGGRTLSVILPENADDGDIRTSEHGIDQEYTREGFGVSAHLTWDTSVGEFVSISAYRESESREYFSFSATSYTFLPSFNPFFPYQQLADNYEKPTTWSQEFRVVSNQMDNFSYVAGIYLFKDEVERMAGSIRLAGQTGNKIRDLVYDQDVDTQSAAIYADAEYQLSETLTANFGGRYTIEKKEVQVDFRDWLNSAADFSSPTFDEKWNEFTPRVSLSWQPIKNVNVYGSYTQGFTSGGFNTEGNNSSVIGKAFDPETINAFEIGTKGDFLENRLRVNLSVFTQRYKDKQEGFLDPSFNFVIVNASEADIDGFEIEASIVLNDYLTLNTNYAYLDATYNQFAIEQADGSFEDRSGNFLPSSPKNSFNLGLNGYYPVGTGEIVGSINYSWQNDYFTGSENRDTFLIESFSVLNGQISYETDSQWRFTLWSNNITDEEYVLIRSDFGNVIGIGEHYAMPRTYGIRISKIFE